MNQNKYFIAVLCSTSLFLQACNNNHAGLNLAPVVNEAIITDNNGDIAVIGDSLTGSYVYADAENDAEGASTFRWLRNGIAITGETDSDYVIGSDDFGVSLIFEVTPIALTGTTSGEPFASDSIIVENNSAPTASSVSIEDSNGGNVIFGDSLVGTYTYDDSENDAEGSSTFRWLRDGVAISAATATSYVITSADNSTNISFEVTPIAATGALSGTPTTSAEIAVAANSIPVATNVSITDDNGGNVAIGDSLTGSYGYSDFEGDLEGASTYQWMRGGSAVNGATGLTYQLVEADNAASITFAVTPIAMSGSSTGASVSSNPLVVENNSAPTATTLTITDANGGSAIFGDVLSGNYVYSDVDGDSEASSSIRWLRNGSAIAGATASNYTIVAADNDQSLTFEVTPIATTGITTGVTAVSPAFSIGSNLVPTVSNVGVSDNNGGTTVFGDVVTGSYVYSDLENDLEGASTYRWLRDNVEIIGASGINYTIVGADNSTTLIFEVTPIAGSGASTGLAVLSSGLSIEANSVPTVSGVTLTDDNGDTANVGDSITGSYTYDDLEGDTEGTSTFRWLRDSTAISGETSSSYVLIAADMGAGIVFEVTPIASSGATNGTAEVSSALNVNSKPIANSVVITDDNGGTAIFGDVLTGSYNYSDQDSDLEGASSFRWLRDSIEISGATSISYTITAQDNSTSLTFEVTPIANSGTTDGDAVISSSLTIEANSAPTASSVTLTDDNGDTANIGDNVTGTYTYDDLEGDTEGTSTYRWLRDNVEISGQTSSTYILAAADMGASIVFEVIPIASAGTTNGTAELSNGLTVNSIPTVTNVAIVDDDGGFPLSGDSLTGSYTFADADSDLEGASTYRWFRDGIEIISETSVNYVLATADFPSLITFEVTPISATGSTNGDATLSLALSLGSAPVVNGSARFIDVNNNGVNDSGDQLIIPFDQDIVVNSVISSDLELPVTNDTFGSGATFSAGPANNEMTVTMGTASSLKSRQEFNSTATQVNSGSGVDISGTVMVNAIESIAGVDAESSTPVDVIAGFVDSNQSLLFSTLTDNSNAVAYGDFDGDGDQDIVVANRAAVNRIYLNDGSGVFTTASSASNVFNTEDIVVGDIDGDGDLDYVTANNGSQANRVYLNNGSAIFTDTNQTLGSSNSRSVILSDIDGDGDLDLVVGNVTTVADLYINDGSGNFTATITPLPNSATNVYAIAPGDIDKDGDIDLVLAKASSNQVLLNDGTGVFTHFQSHGASILTYDVQLADFDNDGDLDIVYANRTSQDLIYLNDGVGSFTQNQSFETSVSQSYAVEVIDMDADGDIDLVFAIRGAANKLYLNNGSGTFADSGLEIGSNETIDLKVLDVNGDGDLDIVEANDNEGNRVYLNSLSASWGTATYARTTLASIVANGDEVELVDVDNDGDLDLFVTGTTGADLYLNDGSGVYSDASHSLAAVNIEHIQAIDIDKDGDQDIIIAITGGAVNNLVYTNDGSGVFALSQSIATNNSKESAMGDIDGDGDIDMVIASYNSANTVWLNNAGVFTDSGQTLGSERTYGVALGDMDGDGDLDLVTANDSDFMRVYLNDGAGVFTQTTQTTLGGGATSLDLGDMDGDGDLDVVFGWSSNVARVFLNDGNALLTNTFLSLTGVDLIAREVKLADFDADGDLDLFVALEDVILDRSDDPDVVYLNDGAGNFSDANSQVLGSTTATEFSRSVRLGDIDNDGDIDAVFGHGESPNVTIHINQ